MYDIFYWLTCFFSSFPLDDEGNIITCLNEDDDEEEWGVGVGGGNVFVLVVYFTSLHAG